MSLKIVVLVLIIWNLAVFLMYGMDKRKSKMGKWRISEKNLILMALFMGGPGAVLGMNVFRHKTKHLKFRIGVPLALFINIGAVFLWLYFSAKI